MSIKERFSGAALITVMVVVGILLFVFGPLLTIWIINTLFGTATPYTFVTWFAALLGHLSIRGLANSN